MSEQLFTLADQLRSLRDEKAETEQRLKEINAAIDEVDYRLSEMMAETETQNKSCPGQYLYDRHGEIAAAVNARLNDGTVDTPTEETVPTTPVGSGIHVGDLVEITGSAYYSGKAIPAWVKAKRWYVLAVSGDRVVIHKSEDGKNAIESPVNAADLRVVKTADSPAAEVEPESCRTYTVVKGDSLWAIANRELGKGSRYKEIKALNGLTSDLIFAGQVLKLPEK